MSELFTSINERFKTILGKSLFQDSFWMLSARLVSSVIQVIYFIFLARLLGNEYYGLFEGTKALWGMVFPFIGLGMGNVLVQNVSRDRQQFSHYWGDTIIISFASLGVALLTIFPLAIVLLPSSPPLFILLLFLGDLLGLKFCNLSTAAFIANDQVKQGARFDLIYTFFKLLAVLALALFPPEKRLIAWGTLYFLGSTLPAIVLTTVVQRRFGKPKFRPKAIESKSLSQGFFFSLSDSAASINGQIDRTMLVSLSSPTSAGIYGAGVRFIDMAFLPIFAIQSACYPRFFKHGETGIRGTLGFVRKLIPFAIVYGFVTFAALSGLSGWVPMILGEGFKESSSVIIWLAPVVLVGAFQGLAADALTGAGYQRSRSFVQVAAAGLNVSLNLYLIPLYSWQGAIWATLSSEVFKLLALWTIVVLALRKSFGNPT